MRLSIEAKPDIWQLRTITMRVGRLRTISNFVAQAALAEPLTVEPTIRPLSTQ